MYAKPKLEKFGSFRTLTQVGFNGGNDGYIILGPNNTTDIGCEFTRCPSTS